MSLRLAGNCPAVPKLLHIAVPSHYVVEGILHAVPLQEGGYFVQLPGGRRYQVIERTCLAIPFGFTMSPLVWAKVFKVLTRALRKAGIPCLIYVDDGMASMPSRAAALVAQDLVQQLFLQSGLTRALDKGAWEPSQVLEDHLGFRIDSRGQGSIRLPESHSTSSAQEIFRPSSPIEVGSPNRAPGESTARRLLVAGRRLGTRCSYAGKLDKFIRFCTTTILSQCLNLQIQALTCQCLILQ